MNALISLFVRNHVAANLLMALIILGGLSHFKSIRQEVFPELSSGLIAVSVSYPGAVPDVIEKAVCMRIEERLEALESVKRIHSVATAGVGTVTVELLHGSDVNRALNDVKSRVDSIDTFPDEVEQPLVQEIELRRQLLNVVISGEAHEQTLNRLGEQIRDEISALEGVSRVELLSRPLEISIEVSEVALRRHGLSFAQVVGSVRSASINLPGGAIRTQSRAILLRTHGQATHGQEFEDLILMTHADGSRVTLGEVAMVVDGFAESDQAIFLDGLPAVIVQVFRVGEQHDTEISKRVHEYLELTRPKMPAGISLTMWRTTRGCSAVGSTP